MMLQDTSSFGFEQNPGNPLQRYLEDQLQIGEFRGKLQCHVITDTFGLGDSWKREPLGPRRGHFEHLVARHTILVFQTFNNTNSSIIGGKNPHSPMRRGRAALDHHHLLVLGLVAWEYAWNGPEIPTTEERQKHASRAFIQHVDTTGLFRPRRLQGLLTRSLVSSYICYCRDVLGVGNIHLMASPQPALIFPGSEQLARKRILDGASLITWWLALIHSCLGVVDHISSSSSSAIGHVYCPAQEAIPLFVQSLKSHLDYLNNHRPGAPLEWRYDLPFDRQAPQEIVPLFEDDPKWRHYEAAVQHLHDGGEDRAAKRQRRDPIRTTVGEFFDSISYRMEFIHHPSAFIALSFVNNTAKPIVYREKSDLGAFVNKLMKTLRFDSEADALKSSMFIWSWLKIRGSMPFELRPISDHHLDRLAVINHREESFRQLISQIHNPPRLDYTSASVSASFENIVAPLANDVQSLIRRKLPRS